MKKSKITKRKCPICANTYEDHHADAVLRDWDTFDALEKVIYKFSPELYADVLKKRNRCATKA